MNIMCDLIALAINVMMLVVIALMGVQNAVEVPKVVIVIKTGLL